LGVAVPNHTDSDLKHIGEFNSDLLRKWAISSLNYRQQYGTEFKVLGHCGPKEALMVKKTAKRKKAA
jgi:hypothetical protein